MRIAIVRNCAKSEGRGEKRYQLLRRNLMKQKYDEKV